MSSRLQLDVCNLCLGRRHLVNAYEVKASIGVIAGYNVWSTPERLECEVLQKVCYIHTLTFPFTSKSFFWIFEVKVRDFGIGPSLVERQQEATNLAMLTRWSDRPERALMASSSLSMREPSTEPLLCRRALRYDCCFCSAVSSSFRQYSDALSNSLLPVSRIHSYLYHVLTLTCITY